MPGTPTTTVSKKQRQIVATAERLFQLHGIKRITVEEICRTADVSKMTFYKYFDNKMGLVKHIWESWVEKLFNKLDEINAMDIPFPEKIETIYKWKWSFASQMSPAFMEDFLHIEVDAERITQRFMEFIIESQKKGDIRTEIHPEFIMAVLDKLYELKRDEKLRNRYSSLEDFNRELKDFLWYGLLPRH